VTAPAQIHPKLEKQELFLVAIHESAHAIGRALAWRAIQARLCRPFNFVALNVPVAAAYFEPDKRHCCGRCSADPLFQSEWRSPNAICLQGAAIAHLCGPVAEARFHGRALHRLGDGFRIAEVILLTFR
jgi:hypothetical protein